MPVAPPPRRPIASRGWGLLWGLLLVAPVWAAGRGAGSQAEVQKRLRGIESAVLRAEVESIRAELKEQIRKQPGDVLLRVYLAWTSMPSEEAWNGLKAVAAVQPDNPWVHLGMGRVYASWKMFDRARAELGQALLQSPGFPPALTSLADVAAAEGRVEEARRLYEQALSSGGYAEAHAGLGLLLLDEARAESRADGGELGQPKTVERARQELERAVSLWPDQPRALAVLVELYRREGRTGEALPLARNWAALALRDPNATRQWADLEASVGEKAAAVAGYERWLRLAPVPEAEVVRRLAGLYGELNRPDDEERVLGQWVALDKTAIEPLARLAALAEARGDLALAEAHWAEAVERAPERGTLLLSLARHRERKEDWVGAVEAYRLGLTRSTAPGAEQVAEATSALEQLTGRLQLPPKPLRGTPDRVFALVSGSLQNLYRKRREERPELAGRLKMRVRIDERGEVLGVEALEDTLGDAILLGHVHFSLRDAIFPKKRREAVFEFELVPPGEPAVPTGKGR